MVDMNNNTKTPESSRGAPSSAPFFTAFPYPPTHLPRPSTMPPRTLENNPFYRTAGNPYSSPSFVNSSREQPPSYRNPYSLFPEEEPREQAPYYRTAEYSYNFSSLEDDSQEQAPVNNTSSTRGSFQDLVSSLNARYDSIPPSSLPSCPEASRAASPTTYADLTKYKPMIVREEEERAAKLRDIRDLHNFDRLMPLQEQEKKRSPSLISSDESDSDYLYPDTESESESESFEEEERKSSPVPGCTDDDSDGDYTAHDSDSDSESGSETEAEPSQEQGKEMSLSVDEELRTLSPPGLAWARPHITSWNDLGPRDDDMLYNDLYGLVPAPPLSPYLPPTAPCTPTPPSQEQEQIRSYSPVDDDSLSTLGQAIGKASRSPEDDSLDTLSQAFEKALEKHQSEDTASAKPSLSQDLEKKMLSSLSAYDLNIEKLGKEVRDRCDRICERFDRLEKEKPDREIAIRELTILRNVEEMADIMFPGRQMLQLTGDERIHVVRAERRHRLAERYQERFGISGNAIAGPSKEQEEETSLSSKLDEMIRKEQERLCELKGDKVPEVDRARRVDADAAAWIFSQDSRPRSSSPKPNNAVDVSEKAGKEMDALLAEYHAEEKKDALPGYETDMELEDPLLEGQDPLPASPSSSQGQKRKRVTASDHVKSIIEHFEEMRKHVQEGVEREMKRRKDGPSFEECMYELYPADSEIWKIDDEPIQLRSSKHKGLPSDEDLGNGDLPSSEERLWDENELRGSEDSINDLSNGALPVIPPFLGMSPVVGMSPIPPMPAFPPFPPFPIIPAMPNDSLFDVGSKRYPITRPASLTLAQSTPRYWAIPLGFSRDHRPWRPWIEILEAVSYKPFSEWDDITGLREFIHGELSRAGCPKVTIEACRVKGEENVRLMVFVPMRGNGRDLSLPVYDFSHSLSRISNRLSLWGINDVKVEIWETNFDLMVL